MAPAARSFAPILCTAGNQQPALSPRIFGVSGRGVDIARGEWTQHSSDANALVEIVEAGFSSAIQHLPCLQAARTFEAANGRSRSSRSQESLFESASLKRAVGAPRSEGGRRSWAQGDVWCDRAARALFTGASLHHRAQKPPTKKNETVAVCGPRSSILRPATDARSQRLGKLRDHRAALSADEVDPVVHDRTQDCAVKETGALFSSLLLLAPPLTSSALQPDPALLYERKRRKGRRSELKGVGRGSAAGGPRLHVRVPKWTRPTC
jgi:hypothetical protein